MTFTLTNIIAVAYGSSSLLRLQIIIAVAISDHHCCRAFGSLSLSRFRIIIAVVRSDHHRGPPHLAEESGGNIFIERLAYTPRQIRRQQLVRY